MSAGRKSLFMQHCERWAKGCGSSLCSRAKRIVIARGSVPCQILMVGEAPGNSENVVGKPFVGPAGRLLDQIIHRAIPHCRVKDEDNLGQDRLEPEYSYAFTNLVCCIPLAPEEGAGKVSEPLPEDVQSCGPRLAEFVKICRPNLIVTVGTQARDWLDLKYSGNVARLFHEEIPTITIMHPAAILRAQVVAQSMMVQRCIVTIANGIEEFVK